MFGNVHTNSIVLNILEYEIIADFFCVFFLLLWIFKSFTINKQDLYNFKNSQSENFHLFCKG